MTFEKAKRSGIPMVVGVEGASSSGKTHSGLIFMAGLCRAISEIEGRPAKMAVVDTENRRALVFADDYDFLHLDMSPPFSPRAFGEVLAEVEKLEIDAVMFDTFSHEWSGEGGIKEWAGTLEAGVPKDNIEHPRNPGDGWDWWKDWKKKPMQGPGAWKEPKSSLGPSPTNEPGHKWLVNQMLRSPAHIILSLRSDEKLQMNAVPIMENGEPKRNGKGQIIKKTEVIAPADLPVVERWVPDCEKALPYEITLSLLFVPSKPGVPIVRKAPGSSTAPQINTEQQLTEQLGYEFGQWAHGKKKEPLDVSEARAKLEAVARPDNMGELQNAWTALTREERKELEPELQGFKDKCADSGDEQPQDEGQNDEPRRDTEDPGFDAP
ncbi:MAG: hypothetical protein ACPGWS_04990 [Solirubrobacterales bacterium]